MNKLEFAPVTIICGGYGSGKSGISVNYVLDAKKSNDKISIVDLDIVNPYFRSREAHKVFQEKGIELIAPEGELRNSALPALPAKVYGSLKDDEVMTLVDLGGDDTGAKVLARYEKHIPDNYQMYMVINPARPLQDSSQKILQLIENIEYTSRKKITGLINNTNLLHETNIMYIEDNFHIVEEVSEKLNKPILFTTVNSEIIKKEGMPQISSEVFQLDLQLSPKWRK